jgi:non-specific serine/threonine protein kinase/serine/threonine-protein kinase
MNAEKWQKIKAVLDGALETPPADRAAYLDAACEGDGDLRREVESLLELENATAANALEGDVLPAITGDDGIGRRAEAAAGDRIGNYRIKEKIGAGGMGTVYLAERADGTFDQMVALKIIKRGMDSDEVLRRFYNERQILASLKHPNIAHLIDAGTTGDGVPFFVMEYVDGVPIVEFADREELDIEERLELFRKVCSAVSYAHSNLVIHRDLKPSNILVTRDSGVKLLDFGIAKLISSDAGANTVTQHFAFTPEYASPEQVRGEKLTTATDVYSLGVILYELLTGSRPYRTEQGSVDEIIRAVCETQPERPSAVVNRSRQNTGRSRTTENRDRKTEDGSPETNPKSRILDHKSLRGDLDNIILKALRKQPERRYSSVEQFSEDIRRHLDGLPVAARRGTWNYRASKFVSRNRAVVVSAAVIFLVLIGGIIGTTWESMRAERERLSAVAEREKAERRAENLRKVSNSLVSEIERAIRDLPGSLPARQLLLERAVEQLDGLAAESDGNADLQLELVWAYQNLGSLPDRRLRDRQAIYEKAIALTGKVLESGKADQKARDRLAMLYLDLIVVLRLRGELDAVLDYNRRSVAIVEELVAESPNEREFRDSFWTANYHYALTLQQLGRASEAIEVARKILPAAEDLRRTEPDTASSYDFMKPHLTHLSIGYNLHYLGDYAAAISEYRTALDLCHTEALKRPDSDLLRRDEANIRLQLAASLEGAGDGASAIEEVRHARRIREEMAAREAKNLDFQTALADADVILGQTLARQNLRNGIETNFRQALTVYERVIETDGERTQARVGAARARASLGEALAAKGEKSAGEAYLNEAVTFYESIGADRTVDAHVKRQYAETLAWRGAAQTATAEAAASSYRRSLDLWLELERNGVLRRSEAGRPAEIALKIKEIAAKA